MDRPDFFISYNKADRAWAEWIAWTLEEKGGYVVKIQAWDFRPGSNFAVEMQKAAAESDRTLAVLSPDYLKSPFAVSEWAAAFSKDPIGQKQTLLPVRVREVSLEGLQAQILYVDIVGLDEDTARLTLLEGVDRGRAKPPTKPPYPGARQPAPLPGTLQLDSRIPAPGAPLFLKRQDDLRSQPVPKLASPQTSAEGTIRIAQLSNLLASEKDGSRLRELKQLLSESRPTEKFDYIIVCGNVTAEAQEKNFDLAANFLNDVAANFLKKSGHRLHTDQLFIVPGPNDVEVHKSGELDFSLFGDFIRHRVFSRDIWVRDAASFDHRQATLRHLKDLTLVGLTYWEPKKKKGDDEDGLVELFEQTEPLRAANPIWYDYLRTTPTLLVSSGLPPVARPALWSKEIQELILLAETLGTTLHLFGAGDYEIIPPQPSVFQHLCIGTGPRSARVPAPLSLNTIDIYSPSRARRNGKPLGFTGVNSPQIFLFRSSKNNQPFPYTGSASRLEEEDVPPIPDVRPFLLDRIRAYINPSTLRQFIWVHGLPGNARFAPFVEGQPFEQGLCFTADLKADADQALAALEALFSRIKALKIKRDKKFMVVIRDMILGAHDVRANYAEELRSKLDFLSRHNCILIYISSAFGDKVNRGPLELRGFNRATILTCETLDYATMGELNKHFCRKVPLYEDWVDRFSGGYAGLSLRMFESAEKAFVETSQWSGPRRIERNTCGRLLVDSLSLPSRAGHPSETAYEIAIDMYRTLTSTPVGYDVSGFIRRKVQAITSLDKIKNGWELPSVEFTRAEVAREVEARQPANVVSDYLDALLDHHILDKIADDIFEVLALAPFLVNIGGNLKRSETQSTSDSPSAAIRMEA